MQKTSFNVGVVPEHFSLPFQLAKGKGIFAKHGLDITTVEHPRGTGSMCRALRSADLDIAVALTEGIVADIISNGPTFKLVSTYVQSSLHWAVVVHPDSPYKSIEDLKGKKFGISRFGSGSHLMTFLMADNLHWNLQTDLLFEVKGGLQDLLGGIKDKSTDAFLWETFTTKPYIDQNLVKKIGEVVTPWPCFVIAVRNDLLETQSGQIKKFLAAIQEACLEFKKTDKSLKYISKESKLSLEDSKKWFDLVQFSFDGGVSRKVINHALELLLKVGVIKNKVEIEAIVDDKLTKLED